MVDLQVELLGVQVDVVDLRVRYRTIDECPGHGEVARGGIEPAHLPIFSAHAVRARILA
jgi:hypothetical protein